MRSWLRRASSLAFLGGIGVAAVGMFTLAWRLGGRGQPISSVSYAVGYSNAVAWIAALAGCALAWASGSMRRRERAREEGEGMGGTPAAGSGDVAPVPRGDVIILAALTAVVFAGFAYATFGVPLYDNVFFYDRMAAVLGGAVPWRDFQFPYGPLMLYVPVALAWISARLGAQPVLGYYVATGLALTGGVALLAWVMRDLPMPRVRKRALFWIAGAYALLSATGGLNYTLVRFLAPVAALLVLARLIRREPAMSPVAIGGASLAMAAACAAISPEMGVAYAAASTAMLVARRDEGGSGWKTALAAQIAGLAVLAAILGGAVVAVMSEFVAGAFAFPVLPSPYILLYVGTACAVSYAAGTASLSLRGAAPGGAFVILGLALLPSALGRADFAHVFWNGLPLFIAAAMALGASSAVRYWSWAAALLVVFTAWIGAYDAFALKAAVLGAVRADVMPREATLALVSAVVPEQADTVRRLYQPDPPQGAWTTRADRARLASLDRVALPFGPSDTLGFDLASRRAFVPLDCDEKGPIDTAQMRVVLSGLERARWVVFPIDALPSLESEMAMIGMPLSRRAPYFGLQYTLLMQFPADLPVRRHEYLGRAELLKAIDERFAYSDTAGRYLVMERRK